MLKPNLSFWLPAWPVHRVAIRMTGEDIKTEMAKLVIVLSGMP